MTTLKLNVEMPAMDAEGWRQPATTWWPAPEALADGLMATAALGKPKGLLPLFGESGAPALDMTVTALSSRASLLGMSNGCAFAHHELRARIPMPEALEPEVAVWDQGTTPSWSQGVLAEPKYFSFFQDAPVPVFNPNHRRKWRAHELLHAAQGFVWHPQQTRFAFTLGARVNELLPVIHWYGLDEAFRPRCERHQGSTRTPGRAYCPDCEAAAVAWWDTDGAWRGQQRDAAIDWLSRARDHFHQEWSACLTELETGRQCPTPRPGLDAASDAVGYLRGHWNRVTAWSFGAWAEHFLVEGVDHFHTVSGLMAHCAQVTRHLLSGELSLNAGRFRARRARRALQDLGYRAFLALEWLPEGSHAAQQAEADLMPALEIAAAAAHALLKTDDLTPVAPALEQLVEAITRHRESFPADVAGPLLKLGYAWPNTHADLGLTGVADVAQLKEGLRSACPLTSEALGAELTKQTLTMTISCATPKLGHLSARFAEHLASQRHPLADLAGFEAWLQRVPRRDEPADLFGALPEDLEALRDPDGELRAHQTLRRLSVSRELGQRVLGEPFEGELVAIIVDGEPRIIPLDDAVSKLLSHVESDAPVSRWIDEIDPEALTTLLEHRFLVWLPPFA